jgi:hypothetical protein
LAGAAVGAFVGSGLAPPHAARTSTSVVNSMNSAILVVFLFMFFLLV